MKKVLKVHDAARPKLPIDEHPIDMRICKEMEGEVFAKSARVCLHLCPGEYYY